METDQQDFTTQYIEEDGDEEQDGDGLEGQESPDSPEAPPLEHRRPSFLEIPYRPKTYKRGSKLAKGKSLADVDPSRFMDPPEKEPSVQEARKWVMKHLRTPKKNLRPEMCPNGLTWGMLQEAKEDPRWFLEKICQGVKMTKDELDSERRKKGVGNILAQLERFRCTIKGIGN